MSEHVCETSTVTSATATTPSSSGESSTTSSSTPTPVASPEDSKPSGTPPTPRPWPGFKYEPVRGLMDRKISRFLRAQRKNMRRSFLQRGLLDLYAQLEEIKRNPRAGFMAKNQQFQKVMNEYIARVSATPLATGPEAAPAEGGGGLDLRARSTLLGVPGQDAVAVPDADAGADAPGSVPEVALPDVGRVNEVVIEE